MLQKNKKKTTKDQKVVLKTGPIVIMLCNILGPIFNTTLDQFLAHLFAIFVFAETTILLCFHQNKTSFNETLIKQKGTFL